MGPFASFYFTKKHSSVYTEPIGVKYKMDKANYSVREGG